MAAKPELDPKHVIMAWTTQDVILVYETIREREGNEHLPAWDDLTEDRQLELVEAGRRCFDDTTNEVFALQDVIGDKAKEFENGNLQRVGRGTGRVRDSRTLR